MPTIDELRAQLEALADAPSPRTDDELLAAAVEGRPGPPRPARDRLLVAAAVVVIAAIAIATARWVEQDPPSARVSTEPSASVAPPDLGTARWERLSAGPDALSGQVVLIPGGAFAWSAVVEGGDEPSDRRLTLGGAAYDEAADTWTPVARPQQLQTVPRQHGAADAIWTGEEVLLVVPTWSDQPGAAGALTTVRWRPGEAEAHLAGLAVVPGTARPDPNLQVRLAMDGSDVLALVTRSGSSDAALSPTSYLATHQLWRYDPGDASWARLEDPPTTGDRTYGFEATPAGVLLTTSEPPPEGAAVNLYGAVVVDRLGPDGSWHRLSPGPADLSGQSAGAAWREDRLVVVSYDPRAEALDPATGTWETLPTPPIDGCEDYPAVLVTDEIVVAGYCHRFAALPPGSSSWVELPTDGDVADRAIDASGDRVLGMRWDRQREAASLVLLRWR